MKKNDIILAVTIALVAILGLLLYMTLGNKKVGIVSITVDGQLYGTYSLNEDREIRIHQTNVVLIKDGQVDMIEANCPDQTCVEHKTISKNKETIICLPNKVIVEIVGGMDGNLDTISK